MQRIKWLAALLLVVLLVGAFAVGCAKDDDKNGTEVENGENGEDEVDLSDAEEIVLGYTGPLSGISAEYGQDCLNGVDMAVKEINAAGGITVNGKKYIFRLESLDDQADPTQTVNNARKMMNLYNTKVIYNPVFTSIAPLLEINQNEGEEFLIIGYSSVPGEILVPGNELVVYCTPLFTVYVEAFATKARELGWETCAMVVTVGSYGETWRSTFKQYWEAMGGTITIDQPANYYGEMDFSADLTAAIATNPDFMLIGGPSTPTALVIEQARSLGYKGGFIVIDQAKPDYIAQFLGGTELMENTLAVATVDGIPYKASPDFLKRYDEMYVDKDLAEICSWEAIFSYGTTWALAKAIEKAGTVDDIRAIRAAMAETCLLLGDEYPMESAGIKDNGRMLISGGTQYVLDGKFQSPEILIWWPETEEEYNEVIELFSIDPTVTPRWLKPRQ